MKLPNETKFSNSVDFTSRFYQPDIFSDNQKRKDFLAITGISHRRLFPGLTRRIAVAAACTALIASASYILYISHSSDNPDNSNPVKKHVNNENPLPEVVDYAIIDFNDSPLSVVIKEIEKVYGVSITNIPSEDFHLTLHYEGDVEELVTIINELLDIHLKIEREK